MPTYEYECGDCSHRFEEFQSITADKLVTCPECDKDTLERLIGAGAAVLFKGSGFYQTDYRSDDYNAKASADKGEGGSKGDSKSDGKSDSGSGSASSSDGGGETKSAPATDSKSASTPAPKSESTSSD